MGGQEARWLAGHLRRDAIGRPLRGPVEDIVRFDEYDPEVYIINGTLHDMITAADQAPGVVVEARDEEEE